MKDNSIDDKITALKRMANTYEMKMRGYSLNSTQDKWIKKSNELAGEDFIDHTTGILYMHAESVNLISSKEYIRFVMDLADAFFRVNTMCLNDETIPTENYRPIMKMFKDALSSIGHVTTGSRDFLSKYKKEELQNVAGGDY